MNFTYMAIFLISAALTVVMFIRGLLVGTLTSMRAIKGTAKALRLLEEM